ncbi:hypothetical protein V8B97DRAFT_1747795 [Scleroderma yunnanense]
MNFSVTDIFQHVPSQNLVCCYFLSITFPSYLPHSIEYFSLMTLLNYLFYAHLKLNLPCSSASCMVLDVSSFLMKEYQASGIQSHVVKALQHTIQEDDRNHSKIQQVIFEIIMENHMSNKFNLAKQLASQA